MMRIWVLAIFLAVPGWAWHPVGHRIVAAIAYDSLDGKTRAKVDELIRKHPDYAHFIEGAKGNSREIARRAFINASAWADDVKGDPRFYDDTRAGAKATVTLAGFPDMKRHTNWHYINVAFSPDGMAVPKPPVPNGLTQLPLMTAALGGENGSYMLPWFLHVAGDLHQPLHCVARYTKANKGSDFGGNRVSVDGYTNLHAVWDDLLGVTQDEEYVDWMAKRLRKLHKAEKEPVIDPAKWVDEGFELAKSEAYRMAADVGTRENQFRTTVEYRKNAMEVAHRRAAIGGYRMAAVLKDALK